MANSDFVIEGGILVEYKGDGGDVIIPEGVTLIGDYVFDGCESLTSITIPSSVVDIGEGAFCDCSSLTAIYITNLANWCMFSFHESATNPLYCGCKLYLNGQLVTDLVVPDNVTFIGENAFIGYDSLTSVIIGNSVTSIGYYAFAECKNLTSVTIPDSVKEISAYAFSECTELSSLTIGKSVKSVGRSAFEVCYEVKNVYYNGDIATWCGIDFDDYANPVRTGANFYIKNASGVYELLTELIIPSGITSVGYQAFQGFGNISTVIVGNDVTQICTEAFAWIPFSNLIIGDKVERIGVGAFDGCSNFNSVILGSNVKHISEGAFNECMEFETIFYKGTEMEFAKIKIDDWELARLIDEELVSVYYYSENTPAGEGNFWRCVDGVPTVW